MHEPSVDTGMLIVHPPPHTHTHFNIQPKSGIDYIQSDRRFNHNKLTVVAWDFKTAPVYTEIQCREIYIIFYFESNRSGSPVIINSFRNQLFHCTELSVCYTAASMLEL